MINLYLQNKPQNIRVLLFCVRAILVVTCFFISNVPKEYNYTNNVYFRLLVGVAIIGLIYVDIISAVLLALVFVLQFKSGFTSTELFQDIPPMFAEDPLPNTTYGATNNMEMPDFDEPMGPDVKYARQNMGQGVNETTPLPDTNLQLDGTGFITETNLLDAQINSASGAEITEFSGSLAGVPYPLPADSCQHSKVSFETF